MADMKNPSSEKLGAIHIEVLELVAQGLEYKRISQRLGIAVGSVNSRMRTCFRALGANNRAHAVGEAHRLGLISRQPSLFTKAPQRPLTPNQQNVVGLLADGLTNLEIAERCSRSEQTIKTLLLRIRRNVGARDVAHLVHLAHVYGLLSDARDCPDYAEAGAA